MATPEEQLAQALAAIQQVQLTMQQQAQQTQTAFEQLQALGQQNAALTTRLDEIGQSRAAGSSTDGPSQPALVQKWAPGEFSGEVTQWREWELKFRTYVGSQMGGMIGIILKQVDENRDDSALVAVLGEHTRAAASFLHSSLVATC